jgi:hypothetical protein
MGCCVQRGKFDGDGDDHHNYQREDPIYKELHLSSKSVPTLMMLHKLSDRLGIQRAP